MPIKHLSKDNYIITDKKTITELLVETFSKNSSKQNGKKEFLTIKEDAEKHELNFKSKNLEEYDNLLTLRELKDYIEKSHNSTFGLDEIHYKFLKNTSWKIPKISLENTEQNMDRGKIHRFMETNHNSTNPQAKKGQLRSTKLQTYLLNQFLMQNNGKNNKQQIDLLFGFD